MFPDNEAYYRSIRRETLAHAQRRNDGFVADLPHPFVPDGDHSYHCITCNRLNGPQHDRPWYRPVYAPCLDCAPLPRRSDCPTCGDSKLSMLRVGQVEAEPTPVPAWKRRGYRSPFWGMPGRKWKRRKGRWPDDRRTPRRERHRIKAELDKLKDR